MLSAVFRVVTKLEWLPHGIVHKVMSYNDMRYAHLVIVVTTTSIVKKVIFILDIAGLIGGCVISIDARVTKLYLRV
jgi:hypothetical protein